MEKLYFIANRLKIDGRSIELPYNIQEARIIEDRIVVIYKYDQLVDKTGQFQNCVAFDKNGNELWVAEHPTNNGNDVYINFMGPTDNRLWNFACFNCTLDFKTGKLTDAVFTK